MLTSVLFKVPRFYLDSSERMYVCVLSSTLFDPLSRSVYPPPHTVCFLMVCLAPTCPHLGTRADGASLHLLAYHVLLCHGGVTVENVFWPPPRCEKFCFHLCFLRQSLSYGHALTSTRQGSTISLWPWKEVNLNTNDRYHTIYSSPTVCIWEYPERTKFLIHSWGKQRK